MKTNREIGNAVVALQKAWAFVRLEWVRAFPFGPTLILAEVFRAPETQAAYHAQGRKPLEEVNRLRKVADLAAINASENKVVTYRQAGTSKHELLPSRAIDIMVMKNGQISNDPIYYRKLADLLRAHNPKIVWGGDWDGDQRSDDEKFVDMPHFEI